jgi:choline dehydrogenase
MPEIRKKDLPDRYDFIVCGSGSAGSVIARRLADNPEVSVLLLEAGGHGNVPEVDDASAWPANLGSVRDWNFQAQPNAHLNGRALAMNMGKVLGGGSSINVMQWSRGHKSDWDFFAEQAGDSRWNYQSVLDIYLKIENWQGPSDAVHRGKDGLLFVQPVPQPKPVALALLESAASMDIPVYDSQNGAIMEGGGGISLADVRIQNGQRLSVFRSYLAPPITRHNLTVLTGALVVSVAIKDKRATGVHCLVGEHQYTFNANAEVILSLGAIQTPKVLMQSGLGDAAQLRLLGIPVVEHLPGVGQNFQDHCMAMGCIWEYREAPPSADPGVQANLFLQSESGIDTPDIQIMQVGVPFASAQIAARVDIPEFAWSMMPTLARPKSIGSLRLTGPNPNDSVEIHANTLADPADLKVLMTAVEIARDLANSAAMRPFVKREVTPTGLKKPELEQFVRDSASSVWHQSCTAKMGRDALSVVNGELAVYGVENLRVADASILPRITTGNTMAPCVIVGEIAAELLKAKYRL